MNACNPNPCVGDHVTCVDLAPPKLNDKTGRQCICDAGYAMARPESECLQIDACVTSPCGSEHAVCADMPPPANATKYGRTCVCPDPYKDPSNEGLGDQCECEPGYAPKNGACQDVDACETAPCSVHATCVDKPAPALGDNTGRTCECQAPSTGNGDSCKCPTGTSTDQGMGGGSVASCSDTDACAVHPCSTHATCEDVPASNDIGGKFGRKCTCSTGYEGDGELGGCNCADGFIRVNDECVDIDACDTSPCPGDPDIVMCADYPAPADASAKGRNCTCDLGFKFSARSGCLEMDACVSNPCNFEQAKNCDDLPSPARDGKDGRVCNCMAGYVYSINVATGLESCDDEDSCFDDACGEHNSCIDASAPATGYKCECEQGYELQDPSDTEGSCRKIDPCLDFPCPGAAACVPQTGKPCTRCEVLGEWPDVVAGRLGRTCWCPTGFQMDVDTGECTDMDGCKEYPCHEHAGCRDTKAPPVSQALPPTTQWQPPEAHTSDRTCVCLTGYRGDGELCLPDGTMDVATTAGPDSAASASGEGTAENSQTIVIIFVVLVIMTVLIVSLFVYSMYCKRVGGATFGHPSQQQMYGNSFNNPMYNTGGYAPSPMAAQAMMQPRASFSGSPQYATSEQVGGGGSMDDDTYGPSGPGGDGYLSVVGAN